MHMMFFFSPGYDQLKGQRNSVTMAADSTCGSVSQREENSVSA